MPVPYAKFIWFYSPSCIWFGPDEEGNNGIYLGKDVVKEASKALTEAMWKVGPKVLTWTQIASYAVNQAQRAIYGKKSVAAYKPRFTECLQHFLIHAGKCGPLTVTMAVASISIIGSQHAESSVYGADSFGQNVQPSVCRG